MYEMIQTSPLQALDKARAEQAKLGAIDARVRSAQQTARYLQLDSIIADLEDKVLEMGVNSAGVVSQGSWNATHDPSGRRHTRKK